MGRSLFAAGIVTLPDIAFWVILFHTDDCRASEAGNPAKTVVTVTLSL
jgi:hypothetical protein